MRFFGSQRRRKPEGPFRIYAIGDIHGRRDLLADLIGLIETDIAGRPPMANKLVILGDFIDRGPDSAQIVAVLMRLAPQHNLVVLKGNHEATMVDAIDGDAGAMEAWFEYGGQATLQSYGLSLEQSDLWDVRAAAGAARAAVPPEVVSWMRALPVSYAAAGHFFVHAGVRPGVPLNRQTDQDMLWIRDDFTQSNDDHGAIIVHGHTICESGVDVAHNRIGIDTGAYRTGRLSALGIEGDQRWSLSTSPDEPTNVNRVA